MIVAWGKRFSKKFRPNIFFLLPLIADITELAQVTPSWQKTILLHIPNKIKWYNVIQEIFIISNIICLLFFNNLIMFTSMFSIKIIIINPLPHFLTFRSGWGKAELFLCISRHATPKTNHLLRYLIHNTGIFTYGFGSSGIFFWPHAHLFHQIKRLACIFGIADASFRIPSADAQSFLLSRWLPHNKYMEPQRSNYFSDAHCNLSLGTSYSNNRIALKATTQWVPWL